MITDITVNEAEHVQIPETITFKARLYSSAIHSFNACVQFSPCGKTGHGFHWFPRKCCTYTPGPEPINPGTITAPKWLLEKMEIINIITPV